MAASDPQAFFLTPQPRHLAELRIDTAPSAVSFSAPLGTAKDAGRKRRCLVPTSSVRKRMLLDLDPFDVASAPAPSATPPPAPSRTPSPSPPPSPASSRAEAAFSPSGEFSFGTALRVVPPASPGNIFKFVKNAPRTPAGSDASSGSAIFTPLGPADATTTGFYSSLASLERPKTPTATGPTANGGFVFAAPTDGSLTPTSTNTSGCRSSLASPKHPLTPVGSTASAGFAASFAPSLMLAGNGTVVPLTSLKPARTGSNNTGDLAFPSSELACWQIGSAPSAAGKESMPFAGLVMPPSAFTTTRSPPPLHNSSDGSHKRPSLFLRRDATCEGRKNLRQLEEQQQFTPPPQKIVKTNSLAVEAFPSIMSGSSASPCCTFFISPSKEAAKQEAKKVLSEASQSPAGSHCSSSARAATPEKANKQEREVEVSSSPRQRAPDSPTERAPTFPAVVCEGAEMVVRVTCKCGVHKEFCFDHRL